MRREYDYIVIHEGSLVTKLSPGYLVTSKSEKFYTNLYHWLKCQVDLFNGIINSEFTKFFHRDRMEGDFPVWRSELGDVEVYKTGENSFEVHRSYEII